MEMLPTRYDIATTCRVCLKKSSNMFPLFNSDSSSEYGFTLMKCANIEVTENDGLPIAICEPCTRELSQAYTFVMKCRLSDSTLRKAFEENSPKKEDAAEDTDGFGLSIKEEPSFCELSPSDAADMIPLSEFKNENDEASDDDYFLYKYKKKKHKSESKKKKKKSSLERRGRKSSAKFTSLQCTICGLIVKSQAAMISHTRTHTGEKPFKCPDCGKAFGDKGTLKGHTMRFHSDLGKSFTCDTCGKQFYRKKEMLVHMRRHTGETPYSCSECGRSFSQQSTLIRHMRTHTGEKPYSCSTCGKKFAGCTTLKKHMLVHSDERNFSCNICGKSVKSKDALLKHEFLHQHLKPHICDQCAMAFTTKGNLKLHMGKVHSDKSGICSVCNKRFSDLEKHMRKHTGETPFQCHVCSRCFMHSGSLNIHMTQHKNAEKYPCPVEDCSKKFPAPSMLEYHVLRHHKHHTPHVCPQCGRGFYRSCDLSKHIRTNHPIKKQPKLEDTE